MKPRYLAITGICLLLMLQWLPNVVCSQQYQTSYQVRLQTKITNNGKSDFNLSSNPYTDPSMPFFPNSTLQTASIVGSSHEIRLELDNDGNVVARLLLPPILKSGQSATLVIEYLVSVYLTDVRRTGLNPTVDAKNSGTKEAISQSLADTYCVAAGPWKINDVDRSWKKIRDLAKEIAKNDTNTLSITVKFVQWIGKNIRYPQSKRDNVLSPNETLAYMEGDCDEQSNLLITMLRNTGIPAYLETGALYIPSREENRSLLEGRLVSHMTSIGWHAWAMVYVPPWGWLPVDMTIGYREESPLDSITHSAPMTLTAITAGSVKTSDYVHETNLGALQLRRSPVQISEDQSITIHTVIYQQQPPAAMTLTVAAMIAFGCAIVGCYFLARRKRRQKN